jgi:hypothetical protein
VVCLGQCAGRLGSVAVAFGGPLRAVSGLVAYVRRRVRGSRPDGAGPVCRDAFAGGTAFAEPDDREVGEAAWKPNRSLIGSRRRGVTASAVTLDSARS